MSELSGRERVQSAADQLGVNVQFVERGPASSLEEAAAQLGIEPARIVKTLVAKAKRSQNTAESEYVLVLIPGDKSVDWAKLRKLAGFKKMSMAAPDEGYVATGYHPGTINPFGAAPLEVGSSLSIYADASISGDIAMGAGEPELSLMVDAAALLEAFSVVTGDIAR